MHSRKCTQESCIFRHSSHPLVFGLTFLISSTCVQTSAMGPPPRLACGLNGNSYFKARVARHRFHRNDATHLFYDAVHDVQTKPGALSHTLGGEERLEDPRLHLRRNPWAVIGNLD